MIRRALRIAAIGLLAGVVPGPVLAAIPTGERDALIALYGSTNGSGWYHSTGWLGAPGTECSWWGVTCDVGENHVVQINLSTNNLVGSIPPIINQLPELVILNLFANTLTGTIPASLGSLSQLQEIKLGYGGTISGSIPPELGNLTALTHLDINDHELTGDIPLSIFGLANLEHLDLSWNNLTGGVPAAVSGLTSIRDLMLPGNPLGGTIPPELGTLPNLEDLNLSSCDLTGEIPVQLANAPNLRHLSLGWNQLTGPFPISLTTSTSLTTISLSGNRLSGPIPPELGGMTQLTGLYLSSNMFTGSIPPELGSMLGLLGLYLDDNNLSGEIPSELGDLPNIYIISLAGNRLTGPIPADLANIGSLLFLYLSDNRLTGPLPPELGLTSLRRIRIDGNAISDEVPSLWASLTSLYDDQSNFHYNGLHTDIPELSAFLDLKQSGAESWTSTQTPPPSSFVLVGENGVAAWGGLVQHGLTATPGGIDIEISDGVASWIGARVGFRTTTDWEVHGLAPGVEYSFRARSWTWPHPDNRNTVVGDWTEPITHTLSPDPEIYYVAPSGLPGNDCRSPSTPCPSIADALALTSGHERIVLAPGTYPEIISLGTSMEIVGEDPATTIVDGGSSATVLTTSGHPTRVTVRGLTLQNGSATFGGGVEVDSLSALTMEGCRVTGNTAGDGAGLFVHTSASAFVRDSDISLNDATGEGGGARSHGVLDIEGSTITDNTATDGGGLSQVPQSSLGGLRIDRCEIRGNQAQGGWGGGISFDTRYLGVDRSTIADNSAQFAGAAAGSAQVMQITRSTISGNNGLGSSFTSGLRFLSGTGELDSCTVTDQSGVGPAPALNFDQPVGLFNTIVAANDPLNCLGSVVSSGHNLEDADSCGFDLVSDLVNSPAMLGPLADNGGPTWTHALDPASPAIDAGPPGISPTTDQRGYPRPVDGDDDGTATTDIGAYELLTNLIFFDNFESGTTDAWSSSTP
jgi:Leucine-rich repeat (LRR) protein